MERGVRFQIMAEFSAFAASPNLIIHSEPAGQFVTQPKQHLAYPTEILTYI